jgi:hypothetical protein
VNKVNGYSENPNCRARPLSAAETPPGARGAISEAGVSFGDSSKNASVFALRVTEIKKQVNSAIPFLDRTDPVYRVTSAAADKDTAALAQEVEA